MKKLIIASLLSLSFLQTACSNITLNDALEAGIGTIIGAGLACCFSPILAVLQYAKDGTSFSYDKSQSLACMAIVGAVTGIGVLIRAHHTTTTESRSDSDSHKTQTQHGNNLFNGGMAIGAVSAVSYMMLKK